MARTPLTSGSCTRCQTGSLNTVRPVISTQCSCQAALQPAHFYSGPGKGERLHFYSIVLFRAQRCGEYSKLAHTPWNQLDHHSLSWEKSLAREGRYQASGRLLEIAQTHLQSLRFRRVSA